MIADNLRMPAVGMVAGDDGLFRVIIHNGDSVLGSDIARSLGESLIFWSVECDRFNTRILEKK
jgi:hypothetical protein